MISVQHVSKTFRSGGTVTAALQDVSLEVAEGEIFGVIGQSGAGKSTLIRAVNLLERPDTGTVTVDGDELTALSPAALRAARRKIGMVFQHFNLLAGRTVRGNVELGLEIIGVDGDTRRRRACLIFQESRDQFFIGRNRLIDFQAVCQQAGFINVPVDSHHRQNPIRIIRS